MLCDPGLLEQRSAGPDFVRHSPTLAGTWVSRPGTLRPRGHHHCTARGDARLGVRFCAAGLSVPGRFCTASAKLGTAAGTRHLLQGIQVFAGYKLRRLSVTLSTRHFVVYTVYCSFLCVYI